MSRDIKFRIWSKKASKYCDTSKYAISSDGNSIWWNDEGTLKRDDISNYKVEQFTGLKDVSGKDIYENDTIIYTEDDDASFEGVVQYMGYEDYPAFDDIPVGLCFF